MFRSYLVTTEMYILPVVAGCIAPGLMALGLFVWADCWQHSALGLNAFKCSLGCCLFGAVVAAAYRRSMADEVVAWLGLSSFLGIVVADTLWLMSLQILGARRMIAIDASKPFVAAAFGFVFLGDVVPPLGYAGVTSVWKSTLQRHFNLRYFERFRRWGCLTFENSTRDDRDSWDRARSPVSWDLAREHKTLGPWAGPAHCLISPQA